MGSGGRAPEALLRDPNPGALRSLLHGLYDLAWWGALLLASPWLAYRSLRDPGFKTLASERLGRGLAAIPRKKRPRVLVHGVSVGEVKAAAPIVRGIEERFPGLEVVVSTSTNTGLEVARGLFDDKAVVRFPADPRPIVSRFLRRIEPDLVLLVELEVWPNFLRQCNRRAIPVAVVNGRITELSHGQYLLFREVLPQFNRISLFCVQLEEYAQRFRRLGVEPERLLVTGNVKVDGLRIGRVDAGEELTRLLGGRGRPVIVAGSTHEPEELLVARAWRDHTPEARLVLVPRHPHRSATVAADLEREGFAVQLLSALRGGLEENDPAKVAIVDTIGELERVYGLADLVFVGGSLGDFGGHNLLEPAAQGVPVLFGPHVDNFTQEA
ncbi:MAG TPA: 3-deoxy-D-manno-octulosonic acid transferase, partial [Planctomycetes bacterium]|nr:3-deoxy-D-manno-octulosonic acid transferase [Planctomycetota bacterium]